MQIRFILFDSNELKLGSFRDGIKRGSSLCSYPSYYTVPLPIYISAIFKLIHPSIKSIKMSYICAKVLVPRPAFFGCRQLSKFYCIINNYTYTYALAKVSPANLSLKANRLTFSFSNSNVLILLKIIYKKTPFFSFKKEAFTHNLNFVKMDD